MAGPSSQRIERVSQFCCMELNEPSTKPSTELLGAKARELASIKNATN